MRAVRVAPRGAHRKRILADRDGDAELGAQLKAHRANRRVQVGILTRLTARRHPVGRQPNVGEPPHIGRDDIGDRLAHGQAARCRRVEQRRRRPLPHGHGFARVALVAAQGDGGVGHRHLPGAHHLIAADQSAHRAIADRDQKGLVGDRRQTQQAVQRFGDGRAAGRQRRSALRYAVHAAAHARQLAEQHLDGDIDGRRRKLRIGHAQAPVAGDLAHHRKGAALTLAQGREPLDTPRNEREHVALLRLIAPDLHRRQLGFGAWNRCANRSCRPAGCARWLRAAHSTGRRRRRRESRESDSRAPGPSSGL